MPDTYIDKSIVGFNADDDLRVNVDTYKRLSSVLNPPVDKPTFTGRERSALTDNAVQGLEFPKPLPTQSGAEEAQNKLANISINEALASDDPTIKAYGKKAWDAKFNSIPEFKFDLGKTVESDYEDTKKFINKEFGYSKARDNEDFYYKNDYETEGVLGHAVLNPLRFLGRVGGQAVLKLGQGFGYMGSMLGSIGDENYMASVADNGFSKYLSEAEESFKNNFIPVYKAAGFDDKGFFAKLGDASFWNDTVADGVAFMASQMIDSAIMGNVGKIGLIGKLGRLGINTAETLGKLGKIGGAIGRGVDTAAKFATGAEDVAGMFGWARRIAGEAAFEASDGYKSVKDQLLEDRKNGKNSLTNDEIEKEASSHASARFKDNLFILGASGAFENKFIFQPLRRKISGLRPHEVPANNSIEIGDDLTASAKNYKYSTKLGKWSNWKDPKGRIQFYGKRGAEATFMEGYWEENAQLASERMHNGKNTYDGFWSQLIGQTRDATLGNDKEVAESIGVGGIIGVLGGSVSAKAFGGKGIRGERKTSLDDRDRQIARLNNAKNAFLSLNQIYKLDADGKAEKDEFGDFIIDEEKAKAVAVGIKDFSQRMVQLDDVTDPHLRSSLRENLLSDYTYAAVKAGLYDRALDKFENLDKHLEEIPGLTFDPNTYENPLELAESFKAYKEIYDNVEQSKVTKPKDVSDIDFQEDEDFRKRILYQIKGAQRNASLAADNVQSTIAEENNDPLNDSSVQEYNSIVFQQESLKQFKDYIKGNDEFHKDHIEAQLKALDERKKEIKDSLKAKLDDQSLIEHNGLIINEKKYAQHKDQTAQEIAIKNDFVNQRTLGQLNARKEQTKFEGDQLSDRTSGHPNYVAYNEFLKNTAARDEKVDEATPAPTTATPTTPPVVETPPTEGVPTNTGGGPSVEEVAKKELRRKITDAFNKLMDLTDDLSDDEHDLLIDNPIILNELLEEKFKNLTAGNPSDEDLANFVLAIDFLYPSELEDAGPLDLSDFTQAWSDRVDAYKKSKEENSSTIDFVTTPVADIVKEMEKLPTMEEKLEWLRKNNLLAPISLDGNSFNAIDYSDRVMVLMKIGKYNIPFYISTGRAGKKNVKAGDWFVVFGIGESGWINKGTEEQINSQYGFLPFVKIAKILNEGLGTIKLTDDTGKIKDGFGFLPDEKIDDFNLQMNFPFTPAKNHTDSETFYKNVNQALQLIADELNAMGEKDVKVKEIKGKGLSEREKKIESLEARRKELKDIVARAVSSEDLNYIHKEIGIPETNVMGGAQVTRTLAAIDKYIDDQIDAVNGVIKPEEPEEEAPWEDIVPKAEYDAFVDKNEATRERLESIAKKVMENSPLSAAETAIFNGKTSEINSIIQGIKAEEDAKEAEKKKAEEEQRRKDEEAKRLKLLESLSPDNQQLTSDDNYINKILDDARTKGEFTFVSTHLNEVAGVENNKVILRTTNDENALRTHNVLRNFLREGETKPRIRIINQGEGTRDWFAIPNLSFPPKGPIAVLIDKEGNPLKFNTNGELDADGKPVGFQYSINEYKTENINRSRKEIVSAGRQKGAIKSGFVNNNPIMALNMLLAKGIPVYGEIDLVTNGLISANNSDNNLGQNKGNIATRTMQQLLDDGFISANPEALMSGQENYFVTGDNANPLAMPQMVKVGQAYVIDAASGLAIAFNGKKLRDITVSGGNRYFEELMLALDKRDGKIAFASESEAFLAWSFLRQVIYSENAQFRIDTNNPNVLHYTVHPTKESSSLADEQINFNYDGKTSFFDIAGIQIPGERDGQDYLSFVRQNFETSATPAQVTNNISRFEKLNKRVIFTLDMTHSEMDAKVNDVIKKPTLVNGENPEAFVGKNFKTPKGNIMEVVSYDKNTGFTLRSDGIESNLSADAFSKGFSKFEEITKETPDPSTLEQFDGKGVLSSISKEEKDEILLSDDDNLNDLDFSC